MSNPIFSKEMEHRAVLLQDFRSEAVETLALGQIRKIREQLGADALALIVVAHHERNLGGVGALVNAHIARYATTSSTPSSF
jgi:hypothetical protein